MWIFLCFVVSIYFIITRLIPKILSWFIIYRYQIQIQIGKLSLTKLSFEDILIKKSSMCIKIERIGVSSSLYNQDERKLLTVKIYDVRIEKEPETSQNSFGSPCNEERFPTIEDIFEDASSGDCISNDDIQPLLIRVPSSVVSLAQFFGLHIININMMYLREKWPECLVHASADKLKIEGSTVNDTNIALNISLLSAHIRILQHPEGHSHNVLPEAKFPFSIAARENASSQEHGRRGSHTKGFTDFSCSDPSLMECTLSFKLYIEVKSESWAEMETISFQLSSHELVLQERLFIFLRDKAMVATPKRPSLVSRSQSIKSWVHLLRQYWLFLPQKLRIKCDAFNIKFINHMAKNAARASLGSIDLQTHFTREGILDIRKSLPDLSTELQLDEIHFSGFHDTSASIHRITLQTQFVGDLINIKTELQTFTIIYDYRDITLWLHYSFMRQINKVPTQKAVLPRIAPHLVKDESTQNDPLNAYCIGIIFEVWDVRFQAFLPDTDSKDNLGVICGSFLLQHAKNSLVLTQGMTEVTGEIVIEVLVMNFGTNSGGASATASRINIDSKRCHTFGNTASVGMCLLELSSAVGPNVEKFGCLPLKIESQLDHVQLEWSNKLSIFISCVKRYVESFQENCKIRPKTDSGTRRKIHSFDIKMTSLNVFCHTEYNVSVMGRVDSIKFKRIPSETRLTVEGTKATRFSRTNSKYHCVKSSEITNGFLDLEYFSLEEDGKEIHLKTCERVVLRWCTTLHRILLLIVNDIKTFVKSNFSLKDDSKAPASEFSTRLKLQFVAKGDLQLSARLSATHTFDIVAGNFIYLMADGIISVKSDDIKMLFDNNDIFVFRGSQFIKQLNSKEIASERKSFSELTMEQNSVWKFVISYWKVTFPYHYDFAEAFGDEFLSVFKWIKKVHNRKPRPFTAKTLLPPDIIIQVKEFAVEVCDDPFEVKLRYNYELMEDEYLESCKRVKALEKKIEETRKTNLQLLSGKINNLFKVLEQKNSETYIKRSKKMYDKEPVRTQLFLWKMQDVLIFALADPSFHGTEKVLANMVEIDAESPWPEEGLEFSTLWCRMLSCTCSSWKYILRDYPQPLWDISNMEVYGRLIGAEPKATKRAKRSVKIRVEAPFASDEIERSLTSLKFYHDLTWEAESFVAAYGPCWEPAVSQFNIALSLINRPSRDPSLPLPWWDKLRLIYHGRLTLIVDKMTLLLHASLDPYNTTEEMELTWNQFTMDWTNANLCFTGDLNVLLRTASKYDDVRLMNLPNLKLSMKLSWVCLGNPNDHHSVVRYAPDKVPEYSINQEHDSYRCFRSQSLKMNLGLETKMKAGKDSPIEVIFYGSTLRWFESLKFIISGVTRPTRKGSLFNSTTIRRLQLSRHYQSVHLSVSFQRFEITYWLSARVKKGFKFTGESLSLSSEHNLSLVSPNDGLRHRPRTSWSIVYLSTELWEAQIWLITAMSQEEKEEDKSKDGKESQNVAEKIDDKVKESGSPPVSQLEKFYFLNVTKVEYMRETLEPSFATFSSLPDAQMKDTPNHRLVVHNLKGVWTTHNRDIVFAVYDSWDKARQLKRNLGPDIIKSFTPVGSATPQKPHTWASAESGALSPTSLLQGCPTIQNTPSPRTRLQSDHTATMLQQLIAEADNNYIAYAEDCSTPAPRDQTLQGIKTACATDDIIHKKWLIQLVNSQVLFKGCETQGYVIISAAKSQISQRIHRPTWRSTELVTKDTWIGSLECVQYYATVSEGNQEAEMDNIMWLTIDNIQEKDGTVINEVTDIVGSGQSVGGVVSQTVGISNQENESLQLQRIVSRCRCEFFYVNYGETDLDPTLLGEVQPPPNEEGLWNTNIEAADTFTLMHYDLCASTNYLQYNMVVDILNNLLLYIDPKKKEASSALTRMRFKLQLYSREDQRKPIIQLQNQVRYLLSQLRFLEKEVHLIQRQMDREPTSHLLAQRKDLELQASECKEKVNSLGEELAMRIQCYNETQLSANHKLAAAKGDRKSKSIIRMNEVYFRKAQWRLTEEDGQLSIAQLDLSNFLYSKKTFSDDITEHLLELGFINVSNLLPNQIYKDVLAPAELRSSMPVDRQKTLRIYCREKPPCGGISIIEHFEINVVPLKIEFTYQFFKTMLNFCFPYNNAADYDASSSSKHHGDKSSALRKSHHKESSFYVDLQKDDVEIMKQRAEQNKHFVFIKIPELPVNLSYKGKKEKNIEDVHNSRLVIPNLEYHSVTWTWLDLLLAIKMGSKSALVSQAIKHKLNISHFRSDESSTWSEDDKAKLLLGSKHMGGDGKGNKKSLFKLNR